MYERPENEIELQQREAVGVIRASRYTRHIAHTYEDISFETIQAVHREIFKDSWPEIAGIYRGENLEITDSKHLPPHYTDVKDMIIVAEKVLQNYIQELNTVHGNILDSNLSSDDLGIQIDRVVSFSAWIHHIITYIHPFREGNGRTARLMANLILERYGLVGISVKIEKENKNKYRQCLAQADKNGDLEPLKNLIYEGMTDRYNGAKMKYYL